ncbi:hypothetical protein GJ496_006230 [Pomphorhynchus laevis]|nr:hypothetical protein GJ496_006230 [Pomphorhynchus laevis]
MTAANIGTTSTDLPVAVSLDSQHTSLDEHTATTHNDRLSHVISISNRSLSASKMSLLSKGLGFGGKLAVNIQRTLGANDKVTAFTRGLALYLAVTFNGGHLTRRENNNDSLSTIEVAALRSLKDDDSIHVTKADKGNCVVVMNRCVHTEKVEDILADQSTLMPLVTGQISDLQIQLFTLPQSQGGLGILDPMVEPEGNFSDSREMCISLLQ